MSETLKKSFNFPSISCVDNITGTIVAHKAHSYGKYYSNKRIDSLDLVAEYVNDFVVKNRGEEDFYSWYLFLYVPGSDGRHLPGTASLDPYELWCFLNALKAAELKMKSLSDISFDGEYTERIESSISNPHLEVTVKGGYRKIKLSFWLSSDGKYKYARNYDIEQVAELRKTIESSFSFGAKLATDLSIIAE